MLKKNSPACVMVIRLDIKKGEGGRPGSYIPLEAHSPDPKTSHWALPSPNSAELEIKALTH